MPKFSKASLGKLATCDIRLQNIAHEAIKLMDFTVLCGHRDALAQETAFVAKMSNARFGQSKHNTYPSSAMDLAPYPIDWKAANAFYRLAGIIQAVAHSQGVEIVWGGDFKRLKDLGHFELKDD